MRLIERNESIANNKHYTNFYKFTLDSKITQVMEHRETSIINFELKLF